MRILHTSDWHLGKKLEDISRLDEQREVLQEIIDIADNQQVDMIIIAGDIYDNSNPSNEAQELFYKTVKKLSHHGSRVVLVIAGNHDSSDGINAPDPIARMNGVFMIGDLYKKIPTFDMETGIQVIQSEMGFLAFKFDRFDYPIRILTTPYTNELRLKKLFSSKNNEKEILELLKEKWQTLSETYCDEKGVNLLTAHLYMAGKGDVDVQEPEDERSILHIGGLRKMTTTSVPKQIQYTALGHLHRFNLLHSSGNYPIVYSGSILEYSFNEAFQEKYVVISDLEPQGLPESKKIALTAGRRLKKGRFQEVEAAKAWLLENKEHFVELTLLTDAFIEPEVQKELHTLHKRIVSIIPEVMMSDEKDDVRSFSLNEDFETLFQNFFKYKNDHLAPSEEIMDLLKEIRSME